MWDSVHAWHRRRKVGWDPELLSKMERGEFRSLDDLRKLDATSRAQYLAHITESSKRLEKEVANLSRAGRIEELGGKKAALEAVKAQQAALMHNALPTTMNTLGMGGVHEGTFASRYMPRKGSIAGFSPDEFRSRLPKGMQDQYARIEAGVDDLITGHSARMSHELQRRGVRLGTSPEKLVAKTDKALRSYGEHLGRIEDSLTNIAELHNLDTDAVRKLHYAMARGEDIAANPELARTVQQIKNSGAEKRFMETVSQHRGAVNDAKNAMGVSWAKGAKGQAGKLMEQQIDHTLGQYSGLMEQLGALDQQAAREVLNKPNIGVTHAYNPETMGTATREEIRQQARGARAEQRAAQQAARETAEGAGRQVAQEAAEGAGRQVAEQAGKKAVEEAAEQAGKKALTSEAAEKGLLKWMGEHPKSLMVGGGLLGGLYLLSKFLTGGSSGGPVYPQQGAYGPY